MPDVELSLVGGPTVVVGYAGLTLLTDPTFDPPGAYGNLAKLAGPAFGPEHIGHVHLVLLSHDEHEDNLDHAGRAALAGAGHVLSTPGAASRNPGVVGLKPWHSVTVYGAHAPVRITAVPAQHGPSSMLDRLAEVTGFVLEAPEQPTLYFSGDNSEVEVAAQVAHRFPDVGIALVCAGAARVARLDDALLTVDAARTAAIADLWPAAAVVPVHVDDWAHFSEPRAAFRRAVEGDPARDRIVLLEKGAAVRLPRARTTPAHA
ncbi:MBL fold metallo-hydrolase [Demequina sp. SYSU T00192]|uniref:MBL fold metallo-hydrolase n=1 Tax=Demequina litoralis TaxID=3051660 RepID=A0ABT8G6V7_9MICO|nr:MBL fold metallo-hydrolase [Demequina sp. SYSU T00192]MDN4474865.1 MBL fold metallo-hydrolase [Demequina sp. SYSU T00192]